MPTAETLIKEIQRKIQDSSYTADIILGMMQQLHNELGSGILVPGERMTTPRKCPPLPELYEIATVFTSPSLPYIAMPANFQRDLVFCANTSDQEIQISDTFIEFAQYYPTLNGIRVIDRVTLKGRNFYYQGIERTTVAQNATTESVQLTFTASTKRITDTSGNNRFASLEAGQIINVSGTVSNDGDKTIVSIAPDGSYCTVVETLVDESTFSAGTVVYIYAGVKLYLHYYRYPTAMTTYNDIPEAIPEALQYPLFVYGITARIYDEIEDGIEGQKVNTTNNENRFKEAILMLVKSIPDEGRSFFIGRDVDWRR